MSGELTHEEKMVKGSRAAIRRAIENGSNELAALMEDGSLGDEAVVTQWVAVAELAGRQEDGRPYHRFYIDSGYHDDYALSSWTLQGLLMYALGECQEE